MHFNFKRQFYIDVDVNKKSKLNVMIYHFKKNIKDYSARVMIKSIMFLSRRIIFFEFRYWFTKLKLIDLIWILRKTRHMIKSIMKPFIVYADYKAIIKINRQSSLTTSSTNKFNFQLIRAFKYIQRFRLNIRHKSKKQHLISNALSKLKTSNVNNFIIQNGELNALIIEYENQNVSNSVASNFVMQTTVFHLTSMVQISNNFRKQIMKSYQKELVWTKIIIAITNVTVDKFKILFFEENDLIYKTKYSSVKLKDKHVFESYKLCPFKAVLKKVFQIAHDNFHIDFHRCYELFFFAYYIRNLIKTFKFYLKHCPSCLINQTRQHKPHGALQSIELFFVLFHTIVINFILTLSKTKDEFNNVMFTICKFFKRIEEGWCKVIML